MDGVWEDKIMNYKEVPVSSEFTVSVPDNLTPKRKPITSPAVLPLSTWSGWQLNSANT